MLVKMNDCLATYKCEKTYLRIKFFAIKAKLNWGVGWKWTSVLNSVFLPVTLQSRQSQYDFFISFFKLKTYFETRIFRNITELSGIIFYNCLIFHKQLFLSLDFCLMQKYFRCSDITFDIKLFFTTQHSLIVVKK